MVSATTALLLLLTTLSTAISIPRDTPKTDHYGPQARHASTAQPLSRRVLGGEVGDGYNKTLRYSLQQATFNETVVRRVPSREPPSGENDGKVERRDGWTWKHLEDFRGYAYFMTIEIGNPPQSVSLTPDTGSFATWVNPNCESSASPPLCGMNGFYRPEQSDSAMTSGEMFSFQYGSGAARGSYYEDRIYFRNEDVGIRQKFGLASDSEYAVAGILGLGYARGYTIGYAGIVDSLVAYDVIHAPVFSVCLGKLGEGTSEIVFGGINLARFAGYLQRVPVWPSVEDQPVGWVHFWVNMTSFGLTTPTRNRISIFRSPGNREPVNALVDTGVTYSYLPEAIVDALAAELGAWLEVGEYKVDCALRDAAGTVDFGFNGGEVIIRVQYFDFILKLQDDTCALGVQKREGEDSILGTTFLRGAYVVYDQVTHGIWMAEHKDCGSQVAQVGVVAGDVGVWRGLC